MTTFELSTHRDDQVASCSQACSEQERSSGSCDTAAGADAAFHWTAPQEGFYVFELGSDASSGQPPLLFVLDAQCQGQELSCVRDNAAGILGRVSRVLLRVDAGQTLTAVAELPAGPPPQGGAAAVEYSLSISQTQCPVESLDGPLPVQHEFVFDTLAPPLREISCDEGAVDAQVGALFVAPAAGTYEFEMSSSYGTAILALYLDECLGPESGCRSGSSGSEEPLILWVELDAGQTVVAIMGVQASGMSDSPVQLTIREVVDTQEQ